MPGGFRMGSRGHRMGGMTTRVLVPHPDNSVLPMKNTEIRVLDKRLLFSLL